MRERICCFLFALIVILTFSCSDCPQCPGGLKKQTIEVYSGLGTCGQDDAKIMVTSETVAQENPALVSAGNTSCPCAHRLIDYAFPTWPVSTRNAQDRYGTFKATFALPSGYSYPMIKMYAIADDCAWIKLNDTPVASIRLSDGVRIIWIDDPVLFKTGQNVLTFDVTNGDCVNLRYRTSASDCMFLEFYAAVTYWK